MTIGCVFTRGVCVAENPLPTLLTFAGLAPKF